MAASYIKMDAMSYQSEYYLKNRDRILARVSAYKKAHRARYNELNRAYKSRNAQKIAQYNAATRDMQAARSRRRYEKKKYVVLKQSREWYQKNKERALETRSAYRQKNRDAIRIQQRIRTRERLKDDLVFKFVSLARRRMSNALSGVGAKSARTLELLGCTGSEAVSHIERQFKEGMSWDNRKEWHIDHIKPLAKFDLSDPAQQRIAFHYTNLQPLWARENRQKAAK